MVNRIHSTIILNTACDPISNSNILVKYKI